jgi:hypothetical protein
VSQKGFDLYPAQSVRMPHSSRCGWVSCLLWGCCLRSSLASRIVRHSVKLKFVKLNLIGLVVDVFISICHYAEPFDAAQDQLRMDLVCLLEHRFGHRYLGFLRMTGRCISLSGVNNLRQDFICQCLRGPRLIFMFPSASCHLRLKNPTSFQPGTPLCDREDWFFSLRAELRDQASSPPSKQLCFSCEL